jgi:hypothetical protein
MNLTLFDFGGTIMTSDTYSPFVRLAVEPGRMLAGRVLLGPLVLGYRKGDVVAVVPGSLDACLRPWCESIGLGCICTDLEERDGRLTGRYRHGECVGAEKARRVREQCPPGGFSLVYAYGDTHEDREMLMIADRKYYRWKEITGWSEFEAAGRPGR